MVAGQVVGREGAGMTAVMAHDFQPARTDDRCRLCGQLFAAPIHHEPAWLRRGREGTNHAKELAR